MDQTWTGSAGDPFSYVMPVGYMDSTVCGYCKKDVDDKGRPNRRYSYYMSTRSISTELYQHLVDRCWRRSGTLLYRPNQKKCCCPHYTIRLDTANFHAAKDHRQTINRFNRYIVGDTYTKAATRIRPLSREKSKQRDTTFDLCERVHEAESSKLPPLEPPRAHRGSQKSKANSNEEQASPLPPTSVPPQLILPEHQYEVTLEPDTYTDDKYEIFENYQRIIHEEASDTISKSGFTNFLCNSPLRRETTIGPDGREKKLGSYHQCYRLDGKLVAVGVLDLLPECVSSVYFMYHESLHAHSPGKLSALREISLAIEGGYKWWYAGYYIHSCPKMRYKISFAPQYILDPESYTWDLLDKTVLGKLDRQKYLSLSRERQAAGQDCESGGNGGPSQGRADAENDPEEENDDPDEELGLPLLKSSMPGLVPMEEIEKYDLGETPIWTTILPEPFSVKYLELWPSSSITDGVSIKCKVAELVAMMGTDLAESVCLDFRKRQS